jgi:hypothetical protein
LDRRAFVSTLTNICIDAWDEAEEYKVGVKTERAALIAMPRIMADPDTCYHAALIGAKQTIKQISGSTARAEGKSRRRGRQEPEQLAFWQSWGLKPSYALDDEDRTLKYTGWLVLMEFLKIIQIRKTGVERDIEHINVLEGVLERIGPTWRANPHLSFDEVCLLHREAA